MADQQAYKQLLLYYNGDLFRLCCSLVKDAERAKEIVADVLNSVWFMGERLVTIRQLDRYLIKSVKHAAIKALRKRKKGEPLSDWEDRLPSSDISAEDQMIAKECLRGIQDAVGRLPSRSRKVFVLVKQEAMSHREVQQIMNVSANTIKTHMRLSLRRIRKDLGVDEMKESQANNRKS